MEEVKFENRIDLSELTQSVDKLKTELAKVIVGQQSMIDLLIASVLANGHVLIEGVPGLAKTVTAKLLAKTISANFSRIQFTPDLMPSDVLGTSMVNLSRSAFEFKKGPIFSNIVLIDEINRAPAKTQAALFEVMEERQITMDGQTYLMQPPFLVFATQNPIEHEGTYRLPEAQLDRFLFKVEVQYPSLDEETAIITGFNQRKEKDSANLINPVISGDKLVELQEKVHQLYIEEKLVKYIASLIQQTRKHPSILLGASPRASLAVLNGSKALAAMAGRDFVIPEDIKWISPHVLRHRISLTPEKEMEGQTADAIVSQIINTIEVPR
jgi:MoxR-like ATPase